MTESDLEKFMDGLYEIGCVKFGEFFLSTGLKTPVYFDLRLLVSHPKYLNLAATLIKKCIENNNIKYDVICGVPYGAFAVATALSLQVDKPMIFKRKEVKDYGCKKVVEGSFKDGDSCLLIEDVVVYGTSIIETSEFLKHTKLNVNDCICLLDREQGGPDNVEDNGTKFHSILKASDLLNYLHKKNKISLETMNETIGFLKKHSFQASMVNGSNHVLNNQ